MRVNNLSDKHNNNNESNIKYFSIIKDQMTRIIKDIEEDRQEYEQNFENRSNYIRMLEFKIMERFDKESQDRKETERSLSIYVDEKFNVLRTELTKEIKNRNDSIENFTFYLEVIFLK